MTTQRWVPSWIDPDEEEPDPNDPRSWVVPLLEELLDRPGPVTELPSVEVAAAQGMVAPHVERVLRLAELVAPSIEVVDLMLPAPDEATRIAEVLDLVPRERERRRRFHELAPAVCLSSEEGRDEADALATLPPEMLWCRTELGRLWFAACVSGLVRVEGDRARPRVTRRELEAMHDVERLRVVRKVAVDLLGDLVAGEWFSGLLHVLVGSFVGGRTWVSTVEAVEFAVRRERGRYADPLDRSEATATVDAALTALGEAHVVDRDGDRARLTEFGDMVLNHWIALQVDSR